MTQDDQRGNSAGDHKDGAAATGSGAGADSALAAMLKKRQQRAQNNEPCTSEAMPAPRDPALSVPPTP